MIHILDWLTRFIAALGAINWGFYKFLKINLIEFVFGLKDRFFVKSFVYLLIASAGFYTLLRLFSAE